MRLVSGRLKLNKKEKEAVAVFLKHAKIDMSYGGNGSYFTPTRLDNKLDGPEYNKGRLGLDVVEFMLLGLCDGWK